MPYLGKSPSFGVRQRYQYTATASQTTFSGTDTANLTLNYTDNNFVDVYQNGVLLKGGGNDYTATSGTSGVVGTGAKADDVIEIIVYDEFSAANFYSRTDSDSRYLNVAGDTMTGSLDLNGTELVLDADADTSITADTDDQIDIRVGGSDQIKIATGEVAFNDASGDIDFRVEGNGNANALFVDAGNDTVICGANTSLGRFGAPLEVTAHGGTNRGGVTISNFLASANDSLIDFNKSRNDTVGSHTIVQDNDNVGGIVFRGSDGSAFVDAASINGQVDGTPGSSDMPGRLVFFTTADGASGGTERVRITSAGELFVGTTSGSIGTSAFGCNIGDGTGGFAFSRNVTSSACMQIFGSNGEFRIIGNGNASNTNNSYGSISDLKLKENIADSGSQWDDIKAVKVKKYSLKKDKADKANMIGVIAQDLEASGMAGLVEEYEHEDTSAKWKKTGEVTKTVKYSVLYMKALKALQEAMTRIEALETKNDALEARIKKLEDG